MPREGHLAIRIEREEGFVLLRVLDGARQSVTLRVRPGRASAVSCLVTSVANNETSSHDVDILGTLEIRHAASAL